MNNITYIMANVKGSCAEENDRLKNEADACHREADEIKVSKIEEKFQTRKQRWPKVEVNIALTGDSGAGKSSFINAILE